MEKIEVKRDAYVVIMDTKNDEEFKSFLEEEIDSVEDVTTTGNGFSFTLYGEKVKIDSNQCLLVNKGYFVDVISLEAFELLGSQY